MKTKFTALALITAAALSLAPKPAAASDKGLAIVGGLIGGLIIASAINDNDCDDRNTTVVVAGHRDHRDSGFWKEVSVQVWVPGVWIVERRHHGRDHRRYIAGHYECRTNRVWVATNNRYDRGGRDHRDYGRNYGRDHRDNGRDYRRDHRENSRDYRHDRR